MAKTRRDRRRRAPFPSQADLQIWAGELDDVVERLAARFVRAEPRRHVAAPSRI